MSSFYVPAESLLQSRAFRRLFAFSLAGHVIVFAALVLRPSRNAQLISPSPVMIQVVSAPPKAAAPKPAPAPPPAKPVPPKEKPLPPEPAPPPKPVVKEIVIPKEVKALPEKPKPAPAPVPAKTPPPSAEELLAKITQKVEAQEAANAPPAPPSEAPPATAEGAPGAFDPLLSPWVARVRTLVRANWSGAALCKGTPQFDVEIDGGGELTHVELAESSGDRYCDDTAERALRKSNPLPPPPRALSFTLTLNPKDTQ